MALTDTAARKAAARDKDYKLTDSLGLYLYVTTTGFKSWRMKYRFGKKEKRLVFGPYPEISLQGARDMRDEARRQLREHRDPAAEREKAKSQAIAEAEATFESVARRWHADQAGRLTPAYHALIIRMLDRDVFPRFGSLPIADVNGPMVLAALRRIAKRGAIETAHRTRQQISSIFVYAMSEGVALADVAATLGKALPAAPKARKHPAITDLGELRVFVRAFEAAQDVGAVVRFASRLLALTDVRPGVLATATWDEFEGMDWSGDFVGPLRPLWRISAARMKLYQENKGEKEYDHILVLARQTVELLKVLRRISGRSPYLFPSARGWQRPMSSDALRMAYRRLGYGDSHVPHGWRASFSTIMNDRAKKAKRPGDRAIIDLMLAHVPEGVSASELQYNRMEHMGDFARIAQDWADVLLAGQKTAEELLFVDD